MYYINYFFIYSFLGYLYECFLGLIKDDKVGSGILYGPVTPVYGVGTLLILIVSKFIFDFFKLSILIESIIIAIIMAIILTVVELVAGLLIERIFKVAFWDYSKFKFHIGKYIALEVTLVWIIGTFLAIYLINPIIDSFVYYIPSIVTYFFIILFIIDFFVTLKRRKVHR